MDDLDEILKGSAPAEQPQGQDPEPQQAAAPEPMGDTEPQAAAAPEGDTPDAPAPAEDGAPPAPGSVPLAALTAERKERQDWKEKAVRAEEQRNAMERELQELRARYAAPAAQTQPPAPAAPPEMPDPVSDPAGFTRWQQDVILNERMNMSEQMVRAQHQDVDEMVEVFKAEAAKNPSLAQQLRAQPHPWAWAYQQAKRIKAMSEIGDPDAYRAKIEAEVRSRIEAEMAQQPAPRPALPNLPPSLANARSAGPRIGPAFTGPAPLESLLAR